MAKVDNKKKRSSRNANGGDNDMCCIPIESGLWWRINSTSLAEVHVHENMVTCV